ncbi:TIGR02328 family protein [Aquibacillus koreensis]|uniref:TIGR02328 family protein n=1 Tax=Aquibacillus koreensis TaxID=279446 RepID=A0A9X4AJS3_9BACI|nr:TIGR02328 family protein [Aquibacillus koreensis]MCT2536200.1 TIGR02328 family protein [Aquibacillus koreensis]MDC3422124.1 TIGR02328 family protein [Aquibacillus koreensis]
MRLWHEALIKHLPRQQLLGQHRECCALRGKGWGRPHSTVNYVFQYAPIHLVKYHRLIIDEMENRGYNVDPLWLDHYYRGKSSPSFDHETLYHSEQGDHGEILYVEHDTEYLEECLNNLREKGIVINKCDIGYL